jgi:DDE superfamily endonuclease
MWCVGALTEEYRHRMYALLALYATPLPDDEPLVRVDEKSIQLLAHSRPLLPTRPGGAMRQDYEYERGGTRNLFVAVEPRAGHCIVTVTKHRGKIDFVTFISHLLQKVYVDARRVHLVLDNLNTHFRKTFEDVLGVKRAAQLLRRVEFHYTPEHASWLNMAEIDITVLSRQCLDRRLPDEAMLIHEVAAWEKTAQCPATHH